MTQLIGYQSVLDCGVVSASSVDPQYPVANISDWLPHDFWSAAAAGVVTVDVDCGSAVEVDYLAIGRHNLGKADTSYVLQYSADGVFFSDCFSQQVAVSDATIMVQFQAVSAQFFRLRMDSVSPVLIGLLAVGKALRLPGPYPGFQPPRLNVKRNSVVNISNNGVPVSSLATAKGASFSIEAKWLHESVVSSDVEPFVYAARARVFFYAWFYENHPSDVVVAWFDGVPDMRYPAFSRVDVRLKCVSMVEAEDNSPACAPIEPVGGGLIGPGEEPVGPT